MNNVLLEKGDLFTPSIRLTPEKFASLTKSFSSSDVSILEVEDGIFHAKENGNADVTVSVECNSKVFSEQIGVEVSDIDYNISSTRTATGIVIARKTDTIEIGEEFALQAYVTSEVTDEHPYPYGYSDDNLVCFESSNESIATVKNGVIKGISTGEVTITAYDITKSVSESFTVNVIEEEIVIYTDWEISNGEYDFSDAEKATTSLISIMEQAEGKRVILPKDSLIEISPAYGTVIIPNNSVLDLNGSILQIIESELTQTGYQMFLFSNASYSSIENGTIYGERYLLDTTGNEHCISVKFNDSCYKCGVKKCTTSQSPGFNISVSDKRRTTVGCKLSIIEAGGINDNGVDEEADYTFRTNDFINISSVGDWFSFGNYQGYQGYLYLSARMYNIYFYDSNKNFISCLKKCVQFYKYDKPSNAVFAKITFQQGSIPTSADADYHAIAHITTLGYPNKCYVKDCILEDNYSLAIAATGGENFLIENCYFADNGYRDPHSHIDWEDGRNNAKGHILRYCTFVDGGQVTNLGSDGLVVHNNVFKDTKFVQGGEVQNARMWLNQFDITNVTIETKTDMVFSQNYAIGKSTFTLKDNEATNFKIRVGS